MKLEKMRTINHRHLLNTCYLLTSVFGLGDINISSLWCRWGQKISLEVMG